MHTSNVLVFEQFGLGGTWWGTSTEEGFPGILSLGAVNIHFNHLTFVLETNSQPQLHLFDLKEDSKGVVLAKSLELALGLFDHHLLELPIKDLRVGVFICLLFCCDVVKDVVREGSLVCVLVKTAAAESTHKYREDVGDLLDDEQNQEDGDANRVQDHVLLLKSLRFTYKE